MAIAGRAVPVRASIGLAVSSTAHDASELLRNADVAMYAAKSQGKHRVAVYERALHEEALRRYRLASDLERAIHHDELVVHYQPILDLETRQVVGAEALLRWERPSHGLVPAGAFIDIAEESDSIVAIRRTVVDQVCRFVAARGEGAIPVWVNLSTRDLLEPALAAELESAVAEHAIDPAMLVFEVTEGLMIADPAAASRVLGEVRALGARIALDDFGTGYSSLSTLRHLPVDILKIAKPFVDDIAATAESTAYVEAIVRMGQVLGLTVVAEGIEHELQVERLRALGCDLGQGFLFTPAVEPHRLAAVVDHFAGGRSAERAIVS
jgi:EAL domain-containing protein (putative c-di-GMP-specific phosphodiesterase class I)